MYILIKIAQSYTLYLSKPYLCTDFYTIELKIMKKTLFLALIAVLMIACDGSKQQFTVEGQVDVFQDSFLSLLDGLTNIDHREDYLMVFTICVFCHI